MRLDPDQLDALADLVADRLAERLAAPAPRPGGLVDAATVAERLGVARSWVYAHADELGAVRLGEKGKAKQGGPRLRFDLDAAIAGAVGVSKSQIERDAAGVPGGTPDRVAGRRPRRSQAGSVLRVRP